MMSPRLFYSTLLAAGLSAASFSTPATAQQNYASPAAAADALAAAAKSGDQRALLVVLGRSGWNTVSSGDDVADAAARQRFTAAYEAKHSIAADGDKKAILILGDRDYPFPFPIVRNRNNTWSFDIGAGREEIFYRRIGRNEIDAIQTCLAYVDAQNDFASKDRDGKGAGAYAQRVISRPGTKNGLYWPDEQGADESPLGELFAAASQEGYKPGTGRGAYHGYYYKILTRQGAAAQGGAADYLVKGRMIGGFALVAWPAIYGNSGVMTFMVNHFGTVYQKDLGRDTPKLVKRIVSFNPDQTWSKVDTAKIAGK
jgi:Protein of unknown function (DUF2950)